MNTQESNPVKAPIVTTATETEQNAGHKTDKPTEIFVIPVFYGSYDNEIKLKINTPGGEFDVSPYKKKPDAKTAINDITSFIEVKSEQSKKAGGGGWSFDKKALEVSVKEALSKFQPKSKSNSRQSQSAQKSATPQPPAPVVTPYDSKLFTDKQLGCIKKQIGEDNKGNKLYGAITNFYFEVLKEVKDIDIDTVVYEAHIICNGKTSSKWIVTTETLSQNALFENALRQTGAGLGVNFNSRDIVDIRHAFTESIENDKLERIVKTSKIGWHIYREIAEKLGLPQNIIPPYIDSIDSPVYLTKSSIITAKGIFKNDLLRVEVPDTSKARFIDVLPISDEKFNEVGKHIREDLMNLHDPFFNEAPNPKGLGILLRF